MSLFAKHNKPASTPGNRNGETPQGTLHDASRPALPGEMRDPPRDRRLKSLVQSDLVIEGNLETTGILEFSGTIIGDICVDTLVLKQGGKITGNVQAKHLSSSDTITGRILAEDVTLKSKSITNADIFCQQLSVEPGAAIMGAVECNPRRKR
jgi:cytoskeletal protein CcmA (bactofilin family)